MFAKNNIGITVVKPFSSPSYNTDIVVFSNETPYYEKEKAMEHLYKCIKYAKKNKIYVVTCKFIKDDNIVLCMISPDGEILGWQGATHLNLTSRGKFTPYNNINIINTPIGNYFLAVDTDIFHPEIAKIVKSLEGNVIISSRYMDKINDLPYRACIGAENMAYTNGLYVLDVTEEGGRFVNPFKTACFRTSNTKSVYDKCWFYNLNLLDSYSENNIIEQNTDLFKKYVDILEK